MLGRGRRASSRVVWQRKRSRVEREGEKGPWKQPRFYGSVGRRVERGQVTLSKPSTYFFICSRVRQEQRGKSWLPTRTYIPDQRQSIPYIHPSGQACGRNRATSSLRPPFPAKWGRGRLDGRETELQNFDWVQGYLGRVSCGRDSNGHPVEGLRGAPPFEVSMDVMLTSLKIHVNMPPSHIQCERVQVPK